VHVRLRILLVGAVVAIAGIATVLSIPSHFANGAVSSEPQPTQAQLDRLQAAEAVVAADLPPTLATVGGDPIGQFQAKMIQQFPNSYGGLFQNPDGSFSVTEVGSDSNFQVTAQSLFNQTPSGFGASVSATKLLLTFAQVPRTLIQLYGIKDKVNPIVTAGVPSGNPSSVVGAYGSALDARANQVVISSTVPNPTNIDYSSLSNIYGPAIRVDVAPFPVRQDRAHDAPPWFAGDQIVGTVSLTGCTLGFGVHNIATGKHYNLSAGHCSYQNWYNTDHNSPSFPPSQFVGTTYWAVSPETGQNVDTQIIPSASSHVAWQGAIGGAYPTSITGDADPMVGSYVCREGSYAGEQCAYVTLTDQNVYGDAATDVAGSVFQVMRGQPGDSGGPVIWNTIFGPLAADTIWGGDFAPGVNGYFEEIQVDLYLWSAFFGASVIINSVLTP
jgi:hypothetical protein